MENLRAISRILKRLQGEVVDNPMHFHANKPPYGFLVYKRANAALEIRVEKGSLTASVYLGKNESDLIKKELERAIADREINGKIETSEQGNSFAYAKPAIEAKKELASINKKLDPRKMTAQDLVRFAIQHIRNAQD